MTDVVHGLQLSRQLYVELVRPLLDQHLPGLAHGAALLGRGSEVLGFDDAVSTDHDWLARVQLFVADDVRDEVDDVVCRVVPTDFRGHSVGLEVTTVRAFFLDQLALDVDREISAADWLTFPEHVLRTLTAGAVFHDEVGLGAVRERLAYYPHDVWRYLMVAGWWRIGPEANLVGRVGSVGDELGSALIGARLVADVMRLCFLLERRYAPYSKWFGTAFAWLTCAPAMTPLLQRVVRAEGWREREEALLVVHDELVGLHDALGLTEPATRSVEQMWGRPFRAGWSNCAELLRAQIHDPDIVRVAERWPVGPVDQFRDLLWPARTRHLLSGVLGQP